jgi:hypothetical protein
MWQATVVQSWASIVGSLALIALIVIALGTIVGLIKPADVMQSVGVVIGFVVATILLVSVLVALWSSMSLWQRLAAAAIVASIYRLRQARRQTRKRRDDE